MKTPTITSDKLYLEISKGLIKNTINNYETLTKKILIDNLSFSGILDYIADETDKAINMLKKIESQE